MIKDLIDIKQDDIKENAVLISVDTGDFDAEASMRELAELAKTAGADVIAEVIQKKESPSPASYIGAGRLAELKEFCSANRCRPYNRGW